MKKYKQIIEWLEKVIKSCSTVDQLNSCGTLLQNFRDNYVNNLNQIKDYHNLCKLKTNHYSIITHGESFQS